MELNEQLQAEITEIFRSVQYGRIIFYLNPHSKVLDYTIETKNRLPIQQDSQDPPAGTPWSSPLAKPL